MKRRSALGALVAAPFLTRLSWAEEGYPSRPVRLMIGYAAGGTADISMRILGPLLAERLGQPVVIENRGGAGGIAASQAVLSLPADGYTLLLAASGNFGISPVLFKSLPFDAVKDFDMVAQAAQFDYVFAVAARSELKSMKDIVDFAKANPGKLNIGTVQVGSAQFFAAEFFKSIAGISAVTIPFRTTGEVLSAVRGGDVHVMVETIAPIVGQVNGGVLRALGVTGSAAFPALPDALPISQNGVPGYVVTGWNGLAVRAGTPEGVVQRINRELAVILERDDVKKRFAELGTVARYDTPQAMRALQAADLEKWGGVMRTSRLEKQ